MSSQAADDRVKSNRFVASAMKAHGDTVASNLEARYAPLLGDTYKMPDFRTMFVLMRLDMEQSRDEMLTDDDRHLDELDDDHEARREVETLATDLRDDIVMMRSAFDGLYWKRAGIEVAGLERETAIVPTSIYTQGSRIVHRLRELDPEKKLPVLPGFYVKPGEIADHLEPKCKALSEAMSRIDLEQREADETRNTRDESRGRHDVTFSGSANTFQGFCLLGGRKDLARRVRPSTRRPGRTEVPPDEGEVPVEPEPTPLEQALAEAPPPASPGTAG